VLWSLSVCANDWQSAEKLTWLCTIPEPAMFSETWDRTPYAMEAKILRPLLWFGLLEHRSEKLPSSRFGEHHFYRKTELFDRLLAFEVQVDLSEHPWPSWPTQFLPSCWRARSLQLWSAAAPTKAVSHGRC
jgi:hypothetical protein